MKKGLMFVLSMLCMASLVAGMAYSMVNVSTDSSITLSAADDAMLAFSVAEDADKTFTIEKNKVTMDFSTGETAKHGIQPNAEYTWYDNLTLTNNSEETVRVTILDNDGDNRIMKSDDVQMTIMKYSKGGKGGAYLVFANKLGEDMPKHAGYAEGLVLKGGESVSLTVHIRGNADVKRDIDKEGEAFAPELTFRAVTVK